jgi:GT2 family glycosyltransferase
MNLDHLNVVILAYSRAGTFEKVLKSCEDKLSRVKVVIDYPSSTYVSEQQKEILKIIANSNIECDLINRFHNHGLAASVIRAIKEELESKDHIVLLEDDCVPQEGFFEFVSESLSRHRDNPNISSVCGTISSTPFNPWGWATWKHKWNYEVFSKDDITNDPEVDQELRQILKNDKLENSIWSINWLVNQYKNKMTSVFPEKHLIENIGIESDNSVHDSKLGYTAWLLSKVAKL